MPALSRNLKIKLTGTSIPLTAPGIDDELHRLAFNNTLQANVITITQNGKIITANRAACKLLGYSMKILLSKSRSDIFNISEGSFKKMLKQRTAEGYSIAQITGIKKNGKSMPCQITSVVFTGKDGIEKAITTISDMSQLILEQKNIDIQKDKIVADNILLAKSKQLAIDVKKEKIVAANIAVAKSKQKIIDVKKDKIVADNIKLARLGQVVIDAGKDKKVADDIIIALAKADGTLAKNNEWIKYIAKTSYDVMWDLDIATGEIYVGDSIEEMFGYKVKNNAVTFAEFLLCLLPEEADTVEKKLLKTLASRKKSWNASFMLKRNDGSVAATTSRASIIRDSKGKACRLIGAIKDVSKLRELKKKLKDQVNIKKEHSDIFLLAAKLSYDGIWDWNILTNEFFLGEGFEDLFGYSIKSSNGNMSDWSKHLHPDDKDSVEKGLQDAISSSASDWEHAYRFIRADGSVARVIGRASIIRDKEGKAYRMIGAIHDLSKQKELEERLDFEMTSSAKQVVDYKKSFKLIFNSSSDVLFDFDLAANRVIISDGYEKEFGYKTTWNMTAADIWFSHIHPDDRELLVHDYQRMLLSAEIEWKYGCRFLKADNTVVNVLGNCIVLRNSSGKPYRMIGSMHDTGKQQVLDEKVEQEIRLKEKQIADAMEDAKNTERSDIGKELHDNINQLLGASRMYLQMAKRGGVNSETYLTRSSEYTLTAIEEIRKLTKGLTTDIIKNLGVCEAIEKIARDTMEVSPVKISCKLEHFAENMVNDKFKLNIFRIVQEHLNNILKHAEASTVIIDLSQNKKSVMLSISDNGVGFDTSAKQKGIGIENIKSRATAYDGIATFVSKPAQGCVLKVAFPVTEAVLIKH